MQVPGRPIITPAVTAAAAFALLAAMVSVAFVSSRGGLQLPVAATVGASPNASAEATPLIAAATPQGSEAAPATPTPAVASAPPTAPGSGPPPTEPPSATPTPGPHQSGPPDPLLALTPCPSHPGCFEYVVRRGDSYTAVNDRFGLLLWITNALNPELADRQVIVVGQTLYLGRDPEARLDPCPEGALCRLYTVHAGDTLSAIAERFGLSVVAIRVVNSGLDPSRIVTGEVIRLPLFEG